MLWALVMAGGAGARLWPLSRPDRPKPLLKLIPGQKTLLEETLKRIRSIVLPERTWIVGNEEHLRQLKRVASGVPAAQIVGEPVSRNTFATVALGAAWISKRDSEALILILPADHWISSLKKFQRTVRQAAQIAQRTKSFSIFGVRATYPSPSYGYLEAGEKVSKTVSILKRFVEKPSEPYAKKLLKTKRYFWHAGIFMAPAKTILDAVRGFVPESIRALNRLTIQKSRVAPLQAFRSLPNISFDYAVLERLRKAYLIRCDFGWCDVGSWKSFEGIWPKDSFRNSVSGFCFALNSRNNLVYSKDKVICLYGVNDLVVVDTPEALLVSRKDSNEGIRKLVRMFGQKKKAFRKGT